LPRQILALIFIFVCTAITWAILSATIFSRTFGSNEQLQATWLPPGALSQ
jgi:putative effector of murein hydrolase